MFKFFNFSGKQQAPKIDSIHHNQDSDGWYKIETAEDILVRIIGDDRIDRYRAAVGIDKGDFNKCYLPALEKFAGIVQCIPASQHRHHSEKYGLLIHTMEVCEIAQKLERRQKLPPNVPSYTANTKRYLWSYAIFLLSLLHDVALLSDIKVVMRLANNEQRLWTPFSGRLDKQQSINAFQFFYLNNEKSDYQRHTKQATMLWNHIVPAAGQSWLDSDQELINEMIIYLEGSADSILYNIIKEADAYSVKIYREGSGHLLPHIMDDSRMQNQEDSAKEAPPPAPVQKATNIVMPVVNRMVSAIQQCVGKANFVRNSADAPIVQPQTMDDICMQNQEDSAKDAAPPAPVQKATSPLPKSEPALVASEAKAPPPTPVQKATSPLPKSEPAVVASEAKAPQYANGDSESIKEDVGDKMPDVEAKNIPNNNEEGASLPLFDVPINKSAPAPVTSIKKLKGWGQQKTPTTQTSHKIQMASDLVATAFMSTLKKHNPDAHEFVVWLRDGVIDNSLLFNKVGAAINFVNMGHDAGAFVVVIPKIFKDFAPPTDVNDKRWMDVKQEFMSIKTPSNENIVIDNPAPQNKQLQQQWQFQILRHTGASQNTLYCIVLSREFCALLWDIESWPKTCNDRFVRKDSL